MVGRDAYSNATHSYWSRLCKRELATFAERTGLTITV